MRKGIAAVEEAGSKGGFSGRLGYFGLKEDDSMVIRFITDLDKDVITLDFWEFIIDNKGNGQNFAVAADVYEDQKDVTDYVIEYGGQMKAWGTNDLIDPTPKTRSVGLAVVCKEVAAQGSNGRTKVTYEPELVDIETKNGTRQGYKFVIVKQAYKNFWGPLKGHWEENDETICDRYYKIKRTGNGNGTVYTFMEKQPDPDWNGLESYEALKAQFGYDVKVDVPDEDRFKYVPQTLEEWARDSCSEERVKFFLGDEADRDAQTKGAAEADDDDDENEATVAPSGGRTSLSARMSQHKVQTG